MPSENKSFEKNISIFLITVAAVTLMVAIVLFVSTMIKITDRREQIDQLQAQKDVLEDKVEQLRSQLEAAMDEDYIASVAHDKLGMYYPDEIIYHDGKESGKESETETETE